MISLFETPTVEKLKEIANSMNYVEVTIALDLEDVIHHNYEGFLNLLSEKAVGSQLLEDISYKLVGSLDEMLLIEVKGNITALLEEHRLLKMFQD